MFPPLSDVHLKDFQNNLGTTAENNVLKDDLEKWRVYFIIKYIAASVLVQPGQIFIWTHFYSSTIVSTETETNGKGSWVSKDRIWHLKGTTKAWGITPISSNSWSTVKKNAFHITPKYILTEIGNSKILQNTPTFTIFCPNVPLKTCC